MDRTHKEQLLGEAKEHLTETRRQLDVRLGEVMTTLERDWEAFKEIEGDTEYEDRLRALAVGTNTTMMKQQLQALAPSPYFARCDLELPGRPAQAYYFAKFPASEHGIYSWAAPVARVRFEEPGEVSYAAPDGRQVSGRLQRRDQFMITSGEIRFMTSESEDDARELIYQDHFSTHKEGFVLPEIVAQMEKAQDQVIRADHRGPLVISGPAGSGKTTLALHRIAYLRQAPETTDLYPAEAIMVFVQDGRTQEYFSTLLPELGIHDVRITTFAEWALERLGLRAYFFRVRPGANEVEQDAYEAAKLKALHEPLEARFDAKRPDQFLKAAYAAYLAHGQLKMLASELGEGALDRHDLTMLLVAKQRTEGRLMAGVESYTFLPGGKVRTKVTMQPLNYSLVLVDEFQNYLPEQLRLMRGAVSGRTEAMLYIGDLAQQTQFGTIRDWREIGETIAAERHIKLHKVYRNTKQILAYIRELGYDVELPEGLSEGPEVVELATDEVAAISYIKQLEVPAGGTIGVLAKDVDTIEAYATGLAGRPGVHCLTIREAQGVEFDTVCLVGIEADTFAVPEESVTVAAERRRLNQDQLYVALTRAMTSLHVLGQGDIRAALRQAVTGS